MESRRFHYSKKLLAHAWSKTREHIKVDAIASLIVAFVYGGLASGLTFSWGAAMSGAVAGVATFGVLFLLQVMLAPRGLDRIQEREIESLTISLQQAAALPDQPLPQIEVQIQEAIIHPIGVAGAKCFLRVTVRNLTEHAPCMIESCSLGLKIGSQWYRGGMLLQAENFQLITYLQLTDNKEVPLGEPFHYENGLPVIEVNREDISGLRTVITETQPLKRGFPRSGWLGFFIGSLPRWPTRFESTPEGHMEQDPESGEETWVGDTQLVRDTNTVQEVSLGIIDGHGQKHSGTMLPPFSPGDRSVALRRE